jgi:hypothetical protein
MLTAVKLVDQWGALERRLPGDWETVALRLRTEQPEELSEAARILGPMNVGLARDELAFTVRRAGGASGPEAARRLFGRLDDARHLVHPRAARRRRDRADVRPPKRRPSPSSTRGTPRWRSCPRDGATSSADSSSARARCCRARRSSALR